MDIMKIKVEENVKSLCRLLTLLVEVKKRIWINKFYTICEIAKIENGLPAIETVESFSEVRNSIPAIKT